ncbi:hypothetical protein [Clostridium sp. CMCC3677]|uniref:hypothetical protein n=1 Tax=Clostridium sp. CMCC3677 TaxID=2949963 RepID=UPI0013F0AA58|nr:hypothetical protein [Clostridium sp. CMCC3677]NFG62000.1 hypothetical protein [Clostridium botulinum]NFQ08332.1 hypothetical protein [Clostridium botulinum]
MNQGNKKKSVIVFNKIIEKIQLIMGIIIILIFSMAIFGSAGTEGTRGVILMSLCFIALGITFIAMSKKRHKLIEDFKSYAQILSNDPTGSIENLVSSLGVSQDAVLKNLKLMINEKYFVNAYIDVENNSIVFPSKLGEKINKSGQVKEENSQSNVEYVAIACKNCGASNKVQKGTVCECEFCGSQIG